MESLSRFGANDSMSRFVTASIKKLFNFSATLLFFEIMLSLSTMVMSFCKLFCLLDNKALCFARIFYYHPKL